MWRAHDERLDRLVAVKEIVFSAGDADGRARALREARAVARLRHRGVVQIYDVIEDDAGAFLIMELVDAPNLNVLIRHDGPMAPAAVAALGRHMLDALAAAHRAGIVHRDVKPSNVLMDGAVPLLTDFGIAHLRDEPTVTATGVVMGTPAYIAPEHARGDAIGPTVDLYGLGATLYYAVEGTPPFGGNGSLPTLLAVVHEAPRPTRLAGPLDGLLDDLLAKDPDQRPDIAMIRERLHEIAAAANGSPAGAVVPPADVDHIDAPVTAIAGGPADGDIPLVTAADEPTPDADPATAITDQALTPVAPDVPAGDSAAPAGDVPASAEEEPGPDDPTPADHPAASRGDPPASRDSSPASPEGRTTPTDPRASTGPGRRTVATLVIAIVALAALGLTAFDDEDGAAAVPVVGATASADAAGPRPTAAPGTAADTGADASTPAPSDAPPSTATAPDSSELPTATPTAPSDGVLPPYDVAVPADWQTVQPADAPYRARYPSDWSVVPRAQRRIDLREDGTGTYLRLEWVQASRDPVSAWEELEPAFASRQSNYRRIQITPTTFKGNRAALWEYTYTSGGADLHAYNLGVNAGEYGYAINLQSREADWDTAQDLWPQLLAGHEFTGP